MKLFVALVVLLTVIHLNEGCVGRNPAEPTKNPRLVQHTTPAKVEEPTTPANVEDNVLSRRGCKNASGYCVSSARCDQKKGDRVGLCRRGGVCCVPPTSQFVKTEDVKAEITTTPAEVIPTELAAENTTTSTEVIPTELAAESTTTPTEVIPTEPTAESTTEPPEVVRTENNLPEVTANVGLQTPRPQATRPTSPFNFRSKTFGLQSIKSTTTCTDVEGKCRSECPSDEYLRGRFDCPAFENCCVPR